MKVLLLGGYGVFGERLARLLVRDGHTVTIAGRDLRAAKRLAAELDCAAVQMDRKGNLTELAGHQVVIDAAGPFHSYGDERYRLAQAAITAQMHYLDLSDDAGFCAGIAELDAAARTAGICVLSGLSTVPALSSAAVRALAANDAPIMIDTAILPGNRSPRGLSVIHSILTQAGSPMQVWRGGSWLTTTGWSDPADYKLPDGTIRQGWQISVPDIVLFPDYFKAGTVLFRAGLELAVMRYGLAFFAAFRRVFPFPVTGPIAHAVKYAAELLAPFGSGTGGMSVMVISGGEKRYWRLLVEDGNGPFIPAIAARALLRRDILPVGAGPALCAITLEEAEAAMSDLNVSIERVSETFEPIFAKVLGSGFATLPQIIRNTHMTADTAYWNGHASVERGTSLWSRLIARIFSFPKASDQTTIEVTKRVIASGEIWIRCFGKYRFTSKLTPTRKGMTERFGPFTFLLGLEVSDQALHYPVLSGRLGPLPLPRWLLPVSEAKEYVRDGRFHFDVKLSAPITGDLLVHYRGTLEPGHSRTR